MLEYNCKAPVHQRLPFELWAHVLGYLVDRKRLQQRAKALCDHLMDTNVFGYQGHLLFGGIFPVRHEKTLYTVITFSNLATLTCFHNPAVYAGDNVWYRPFGDEPCRHYSVNGATVSYYV